MVKTRALLYLLICSAGSFSFAQVSTEDTAPVAHYMEQEALSVSKSLDRFTALTQPYAPLDFQVRQASNEHASAVRNYLFGAASAAAGLEASVAPKMANDFHCGQPCATARIRKLVDEHEKITPLVMKFVNLDQVDLIAQWETDGDFRVNDTFIRNGIITTYRPEGKIGIVPNSNGIKQGNSVAEATGLTTATVLQVKAIVAELASIHVAAIVRSAQGIRVVLAGNADNQGGLLFKKLSVKDPKQGDSFGEGLDISGVTMLAKDIYYYETN